MFLGRRNGRDVLFVVETKGKARLAKHKLVYPLLSLREEHVPKDMELVAILFRAYRDGEKPRFTLEIAEGKLENAASVPYLTALTFAPYRRFALPLPGF